MKKLKKKHFNTIFVSLAQICKQTTVRQAKQLAFYHSPHNAYHPQKILTLKNYPKNIIFRIFLVYRRDFASVSIIGAELIHGIRRALNFVIVHVSSAT